MEITRCVETRLREGVLAALLADEDLFVHCGGLHFGDELHADYKVPNIRNGPLVPFLDTSINPPQINVTNGASGTFVKGISGASVENGITIDVIYHPGALNRTIPLDDVSALDVLRHIRRVVLALGMNNSGTNGGCVPDPDNPGGPPLTHSLTSVSWQLTATVREQAILFYDLSLTFGARLDNATLEPI